MTNASELLEEFERAEAYVGEFCATDEGYQQAVNDAVDALCALQEAAPDLARQVTQLEAQLAEVQSRIAEQITHAKTRIADGDEMGARVWRIALEDIVRENSALLTQSKEPK